MQTKSFFSSKINWLAIIAALLIILPELQHLIQNTEFNGMTIVNGVLFVISILIIILRTFATNTTIKTPIK